MKTLKIIPTQLHGKITVPSSKSLCHRAIIAAGLTKGITEINNMSVSDDILATIRGMKNLGCDINTFHEKVVVNGSSFGMIESASIECMESGSTLRFLIPVALLTGQKITFTGNGNLTNRPLEPYYDIFEQNNIKYTRHFPLTILGNIKAGTYYIKGNISSQFITGIMLTLPLLQDDSKIILTTDVESKGYIDLTMDILKAFNIEIINNNYKEFYIKGNQKYSNEKYYLEGDFSQAAFWIAAGLMGNKVQCKGLNINSHQGDKVILEIVQKMNGIISINKNTIESNISNLSNIDIDVSQCPDLAPILAVLASVSQGTTHIKNAKRLRIKECDRLKAITTELAKLGADIKEYDDSIIVKGKALLNGGEVHSWNDHRIAMALAIASIKCRHPVILHNYQTVSKSYPNFFRDFTRLGGKIYEQHMG